MYCDNCGRRCRAIASFKSRKVTIHGMDVTVNYMGKICPFCGEELYDDATESTIMKQAIKTYRHDTRMISPDQLMSYMEKNGLSAEEMAERVGCSVKDIIFASNDGLLQPSVNNQLAKVIYA